MRVGLVVLALVTAAGCSHVGVLFHPHAHTPLPVLAGAIVVVCSDGDPVKVLIGRRCPGGVCGFTCAPGRWRDACDD